jgi:hypothetical protein
VSPDEFDLRNALREGEGERIDPDDVIAYAVAYRHARRVRIGSIAAGVVAVAGIGVGSVALVNDNGGGHRPEAAKSAPVVSGGVNMGSSPRPLDKRMAGGGGVARPTLAGAGTASLACPEAPPRLMLPGGGGSGQFGSTGSLFSGAVGSVTICAYPQGSAPLSTVLSGPDADELTTSMNAAATLPVPSACPANLTGVTLTVYAVGKPDGKAMDPVVVSPCGSMVTNGTAIRYGWTPPSSLTGFLASLPHTVATSGKVSGSPAR